MRVTEAEEVKTSHININKRQISNEMRPSRLSFSYASTVKPRDTRLVRLQLNEKAEKFLEQRFKKVNP